ncbi:MAG: hypothetical protein FWG08_01415 [Propionibacteriaceae bacterium]|nr:hypothetical protein [Propionibacteriaceae bacterium]
MDIEVAQWLVSGDAEEAISFAESFDDPTSLRTGEKLRQLLPADKAVAVLDLVTCRRRAVPKLGELAPLLYLTRDSLEQATRWDVAQWRARRLVEYAVTSVTDGGCGVGIDSLGFLAAGLNVIALERDPVLATFATANLRAVVGEQSTQWGPTTVQIDGPCDGACAAERASATRNAQGDDPLRLSARSRRIQKPQSCGDDAAPSFEVRTIDLTESEDWMPTEDHHVLFLDPARRTSRGRSWDIKDLSPSWEFVESMIGRVPGGVVAKLAPGFPHHLLRDEDHVTWVSHHGTLVETTLWAGLDVPSRRDVIVITKGAKGLGPQLNTLHIGDHQLPAPGPLGQYVYEPDPAIIRAGGIPDIAQLTSSHPVAESIAYLTSDLLIPTPFATAFRVIEVFPYSEKALKSWVRSTKIGTLEIKVRGLGIDPAELRPRLKLAGKTQATIILTPTIHGPQNLVVERL